MPAEYTIFPSLYDEFMFWSIVVGAFTFAWMLWTVLVHRQGVNNNPTLEDLTPGTFPVERDNLKLEIAWFAVPAVLIVWLVFVSWSSLVTVWASQPDPDASTTFEMEMTGYQWYWEFDYLESVTWNEFSGAPGGTIMFTNTTEGVIVSTWSSVMSQYPDNTTFTATLSDGGTTSVDLVNGTGLLMGESGHPHRAGIHSTITVSAVEESGTETILAVQHHISAGHSTVGEVWLPNDMDIYWYMTSKPIGEGDDIAHGVLHAPFVSEWGMKEDVVPNVVTTMYFHPQDTGTFPLTCTEFCGLQHSVMVADVHIVEPVTGGGA